MKHPDFDKKKVTNDIAMIKLNRNTTESNNVEYVCVNRDHYMKYDDYVFALGWGINDIITLSKK